MSLVFARLFGSVSFILKGYVCISDRDVFENKQSYPIIHENFN